MSRQSKNALHHFSHPAERLLEEVKHLFPMSKDILSLFVDGDGLSDIEEIVILNTHPNNPDSDNDSLDDREETMIYQSEPLSSDSDSDGFSDLSEAITYNSNPISSDSDDDGYSDSVEALSLNTEPSLVDSDFDGLSEQEEITVTTTNPSLADTDGDGLTDNQELNLYQTNLFNGDYDFNDAVVNYNVEEYKQNGLVKRITFKVLPVARGAVYDKSLRLVINTPISNIAEASTKSRGATSDLAPVADGNKTQFMLIDDLKSALPPPPGLMLSNTLTGAPVRGHNYI